MLMLVIFLAMSLSNQVLVLQSDSLGWGLKLLLASATVACLFWMGRLLDNGKT